MRLHVTLHVPHLALYHLVLKLETLLSDSDQWLADPSPCAVSSGPLASATPCLYCSPYWHLSSCCCDCELRILGGSPFPCYGPSCHSFPDPRDCLADVAGVYVTWLQFNCPKPLPYIAKRFPNRYVTQWFRQLFTYSPTSLVLWNTARGHIFLP